MLLSTTNNPSRISGGRRCGDSLLETRLSAHRLSAVSSDRAVHGSSAEGFTHSQSQGVSYKAPISAALRSSVVRLYPVSRSEEIAGSNVDRAETVIYDGDEALDNARELLGAEDERRVLPRREIENTHFSSWGDGPFVRRRQIQSAEALPVNDHAPAGLRGAGVRSWAGFDPLPAVPAPPEPEHVRIIVAAPAVPAVPEIGPQL